MAPSRMSWTSIDRDQESLHLGRLPTCVDDPNVGFVDPLEIPVRLRPLISFR